MADKLNVSWEKPKNKICYCMWHFLTESVTI